MTNRKEEFIANVQASMPHTDPETVRKMVDVANTIANRALGVLFDSTDVLPDDTKIGTLLIAAMLLEGRVVGLRREVGDVLASIIMSGDNIAIVGIETE